MLNKIAVLLLLVLLSSVSILPADCQSGQHINKAGVNTGNITTKELKIILLTDKRVYSSGDEIRFTIIFENTGSLPLRVLIDNVFVGSRIECVDSDGNKYAYTKGYNSWSPKAGVFTGRTYLIEPSKKMEIKFDALLDEKYRLIFSNQFDRKSNNRFKDFKEHNNLPPDFPDKYVCAGRIFKLPNGGKYRFTYVYQAAEIDKTWKFAGAKTPQQASTEFLWTGRIASNPVELLLN